MVVNKMYIVFFILILILPGCFYIKGFKYYEEAMVLYKENNYNSQFKIDGFYYHYDKETNKYSKQTYFWMNGTYFRKFMQPLDSTEFFSRNIDHWKYEGDLSYMNWGDFKVDKDTIFTALFDPISWYAHLNYQQLEILNDTTLIDRVWKGPRDEKKSILNDTLYFHKTVKKPDSIDWATEYIPKWGEPNDVKKEIKKN